MRIIVKYWTWAIALLLLASAVGADSRIDTRNVVRICVVEDSPERSWGSGAYLGERLVLTCAHLFEAGSSIQGNVWFSDGEQHQFILRQIDHRWDQAVLELRSQPRGKTGLPIAARNPQVGEKVYAYGYGKSDIVHVTEGRVSGYRSTQAYPQTTDWVKMTGRVESGSSGGPIVNEHGQIVGNLWGVSDSAPYHTVGVLASRTRRFLLPWNARLEAYAISQGWCPPGGT